MTRNIFIVDSLLALFYLISRIARFVIGREITARNIPGSLC